eukprot:TRINITY_DN5636_c0_g1_i1.p1 TRINITY_DN5636_c0_g1~~TRINITY_DN5636_c0_g1_i1.p1  ORF type:complete len:382 (-),score=95.55 TRINITY_DN5636_c0_g1_i1:479-1624(-)
MTEVFHCTLCSCERFEPNFWQESLCRNCCHGLSAHSDNEEDRPSSCVQWYFAEIKGPFTWEQMRFWYEEGHLKTDQILISKFGDKFEKFNDHFTQNNRHNAFLPAGYGPLVVSNEPTLSDVDATSQSGEGNVKQWFFLDAAEVEQGPFSATQIINWHEDGYFRDDQLVRHERGTWKPLFSVFPVAPAKILQGIQSLADQLDDKDMDPELADFVGNELSELFLPHQTNTDGDNLEDFNEDATNELEESLHSMDIWGNGLESELPWIEPRDDVHRPQPIRRKSFVLRPEQQEDGILGAIPLRDDSIRPIPTSRKSFILTPVKDVWETPASTPLLPSEGGLFDNYDYNNNDSNKENDPSLFFAERDARRILPTWRTSFVLKPMM